MRFMRHRAVVVAAHAILAAFALLFVGGIGYGLWSDANFRWAMGMSILTTAGLVAIGLSAVAAGLYWGKL